MHRLVGLRSPVGAALLGEAYRRFVHAAFRYDGRSQRRVRRLPQCGNHVSRETRLLRRRSDGHWPSGLVVLARTPDRAHGAAVTGMRRSPGSCARKRAVGRVKAWFRLRSMARSDSGRLPDPANDPLHVDGEAPAGTPHGSAAMARIPQCIVHVRRKQGLAPNPGTMLPLPNKNRFSQPGEYGS